MNVGHKSMSDLSLCGLQRPFLVYR